MITYERTPDGRALAQTVVAVGVDDRMLTVPLGAWPDDPGVLAPIGLAAAPVIVLPDPATSRQALAGARRSGHSPSCRTLAADDADLWLAALRFVAGGGELLLIGGGSGAHLGAARALGGRSIAVVPSEDRDAIRRYFEGCDVDVHVAVPVFDDVSRLAIRAVLAPLELETLHHLVEVDPRPAFDELGVPPVDASVGALAAAAAGVLAGRLAAANRRWREQVP